MKAFRFLMAWLVLISLIVTVHPGASQEGGTWIKVSDTQAPVVCTPNWFGWCSGQQGPKDFTLSLPNEYIGFQGKLIGIWQPKGDPDKPQQGNERSDIGTSWGNFFCDDKGDTNSPEAECGSISGTVTESTQYLNITHADVRILDELTGSSAGSTKVRVELWVWVPMLPPQPTPTDTPEETPEASQTASPTPEASQTASPTPEASQTSSPTPENVPQGTVMPNAGANGGGFPLSVLGMILAAIGILGVTGAFVSLRRAIAKQEA